VGAGEKQDFPFVIYQFPLTPLTVSQNGLKRSKAKKPSAADRTGRSREGQRTKIFHLPFAIFHLKPVPFSNAWLPNGPGMTCNGK
jgi:hypothetical protein